MDLHYAPFSEAVRSNPYPYYRELREHAPVYWAPQANAWVVSRYEDVRFVLKRHDLFSSDAMGGMLAGEPVTEPRAPGLDRILILMDLIGELLPPGVVNIVNGYGIEAGQALATTFAPLRGPTRVS